MDSLIANKIEFVLRDLMVALDQNFLGLRIDDLVRRYTTRSGTVTAYAAIGAIPFGRHRDVAVTVKTGDVVDRDGFVFCDLTLAL